MRSGLAGNSLITAIRRIATRPVPQAPTLGIAIGALIVGVVAGLGAVAFAALIDGIHWVIYDLAGDDWLGSVHRSKVILLVAVGMLPVGWITLRFAREARGHGVPEVMLAVETAGGRIRPRVAVAKSLASALTIGAGGSVGKEGPIVQIGAAFGSSLAQLLRLREEQVQLLLACGAAGGIAGTFNAPIAGMFFAQEVILRQFTTRNFSMVLLASVAATVTATSFHGNDPVLAILPFEFEHPLVEIPLYALLGAIAGAAGVVFIRVLYWSEDRFAELPFPPLLLMPVVGGMLVGALALIDFGVLGLSEDVMNDALSGELAVRTMLVLFTLKLVATAVTIGSGGSGGVFRPSLVMGSMIGGAFGGIVHGAFPSLTASSSSYASVGMAGMFAGAARAPVTAVLILFEMTRDYQIVLPAMTVVATATLISYALSSGTIYSIKLARRGVQLREERPTLSVMETLRVSDAMGSVAEIAASAPVTEVIARFHNQAELLVVVVDDGGEMVGVLTQVDLNEVILDGRMDATAADVCSSEVVTVNPQASLHDALSMFAARNLHALPVVSAERPRHPLGVLSRADISAAYLDEMNSRDATMRRLNLSSRGIGAHDFRVTRGCSLQDSTLSEARLPREAVVVTVRRDGVTMIPHGDTRLREGDRVTIVASEEALQELSGQFEPIAT